MVDLFLEQLFADLNLFRDNNATNINDRIKTLKIDNVVISEVNTMDSIFSNSTKINNLNLSLFETSNVNDIEYIFNNLPKIK